MIFEAIDFERGLSSEDLAERREDNPDGRKAESKAEKVTCQEMIQVFSETE